MVASNHELASAAGIEILKAGGNAIDAAVATGFALAVVHPQAGNIGGGGFLLVRFADGTSHFLDYREKAPAAAHRDMYLDEHGKVIPDASLLGYRAAGVPGSVAGMAHAQRKWGKLKLARVMAPAIRLARQGFILSHEDAKDFRSEKLTRYQESRRIFQRNGDHYRPGDRFLQPELARTLERIARDPDDFYKGKLAREIADAVQAGGGLITAQDLAAYEVRERAPVRGSYRGHEILSAPPPSSGGVAIIEILNILEGFDLAALGNRSAASMHVIAEAFRRAMLDRADLLGDPDFSSIPVAPLLDKKYATAWRETINPQLATASAGLQRPPHALQELDRSAALRSEPEETTHYSVVDADGNAVAVTTTLNEVMGSQVTLDKLGFLLNDEMDDFTLKPGVPNLFGLLQGPANAIEPGKRPLSAMAPTIVVRDGKPFLVMGARGGPRIITTLVNILVGIVDHGLNLQEAVNAPRFHHQWMPDNLRVERIGFSPDTLRALVAMGHELDIRDYYSGAECILIDPVTGERQGASDPRYSGRSLGY